MNTTALKLDLTTPRLVLQKFIKKKEVIPINSQPKNIVKKFPANTKIIILKTKEFNQNIKFDSSASPLKYVNVYILVVKAIRPTKNANDNPKLSIEKFKLRSTKLVPFVKLSKLYANTLLSKKQNLAHNINVRVNNPEVIIYKIPKCLALIFFLKTGVKMITKA